MTINTVADIAGDGAKHAITTASHECRRLWLTAIGGTARFGDVNVGSAQGVELPEGIECEFLASDSDATDTIHLDQAYVYVPNSTTVTVAWGS
jgi:hypothetical protein